MYWSAGEKGPDKEITSIMLARRHNERIERRILSLGAQREERDWFKYCIDRMAAGSNFRVVVHGQRAFVAEEINRSAVARRQNFTLLPSALTPAQFVAEVGVLPSLANLASILGHEESGA